MAKSVGSYLRTSAIRYLRTVWDGKTDILAKELATVMAAIPNTDAGKTTLSGTTDGGTTFDLGDNVNDLNLPPLDLQFPEIPGFSSDPDQGDQGGGDGVEEEPEEITTTRDLWTRSVVPGVVNSGSGTTYAMTLYPNGPDESESVEATVEQLQIASGVTIPAGTWALVFRAVLFEITERELRDSQGNTIAKSTDIKVVRTRHHMQVPVWL